MKKLCMIILAFVVVLSAAESFACHITFAPEQFEKTTIGDIITVQAIVTKEHRRCELEDTDVQVELSDNIHIVSETGWQTVGSKEIHNTFTIELLSEGEAALRVFRECSKKGISEETLNLKVQSQ